MLGLCRGGSYGTVWNLAWNLSLPADVLCSYAEDASYSRGSGRLASVAVRLCLLCHCTRTYENDVGDLLNGGVALSMLAISVCSLLKS